MIIGCVVKKNGKVVRKEGFGGNEAKIQALIDKMKLTETDKEFTVYTDSEVEAFGDVKMDVVRTKNQKEWDKIKASASPAEKLFAKVLKLD